MFGTALATRCSVCFGWVSRNCPLCGGVPDPSISIEGIARAVRRVDAATGGTFSGGFDLFDLVREP
jgi:hypothetical protein